MGTSSAFSGQRGSTPLVPSWLDSEAAEPAPTDHGAGELDALQSGDGSNSPDLDAPDVNDPASTTLLPPCQYPPIPPHGDFGRFSTPRSSFSRFAKSGGTDRSSLGRAISRYVRNSTGGARKAAVRMGSSRRAAANLVGFLSNVVSRGTDEALRALNLKELAGQPIEKVFLGLTDFVCPDGGSIDEGIARGAFIETIAQLAGAGVSNLDNLTAEQMLTVFEIFATNAIEARLCNDIGTKTISLPADTRAARSVQEQLHDFLRRGVADALAAAAPIVEALTPDRVLGFVDKIYEQAFEILKTLGDKEAQGV